MLRYYRSAWTKSENSVTSFTSSASPPRFEYQSFISRLIVSVRRNLPPSILHISELMCNICTAGAPLSLDDILDSNIFPRSSSASDEYPFSTLDADAVVLPFLSQIDHPTTNEPTWFLHPCETQSVVDEILKETRRDDDFKLEAEHCREWWECWWMVVGTLIDLRE